MQIRDGIEMSDDDARLYDQYKDESEYYDRLQYVYKIKLNSLYGALSNLYFRFYDLRLGESVTATGRMIVTHQSRKVNELLEGEYNVDFPLYLNPEDALSSGKNPNTALNGPVFNGKFQSESVVAGDTDSSYFKTYANNKEDAIKIADYIADKVNDSYQGFMQKTFMCHPGFDNLVKAGREVVADRGIFVEKKRYILHLVDVEGKSVDKLKVMGLDTKKTSLPAIVSTKLNGFIERLLKGESWAEISPSIVEYKQSLMDTTDIMSIGLPKGANKVEQYTKDYESNPKTRLPGHIAAAIFYNQCLETFNDTISMKIFSGMKLKIFILKNKYGRFSRIAIPTDAEFVPTWFIDNFNIDRAAHVERLVDKPLQNILKAIGEESPSKDDLIFNDAWGF